MVIYLIITTFVIFVHLFLDLNIYINNKNEEKKLLSTKFDLGLAIFISFIPVINIIYLLIKLDILANSVYINHLYFYPKVDWLVYPIFLYIKLWENIKNNIKMKYDNHT